MSRLSLTGQQQHFRPSPPHPLSLLLLVLLIIAGVYLLRTSGSKDTQVLTLPRPGQPADQPRIAQDDDTVEDVQNHLHHVEQAIVRMQENTKAVERKIHQVSPALQQNYLSLERQRLDVAGDLSQSVLHDAGKALEELQLSKQNLKKMEEIESWHSKSK